MTLGLVTTTISDAPCENYVHCNIIVMSTSAIVILIISVVVVVTAIIIMIPLSMAYV
jgi:hypothetical protein